MSREFLPLKCVNNCTTRVTCARYGCAEVTPNEFTNLQAAKPEQAQTAVGLPELPTADGEIEVVIAGFPTTLDAYRLSTMEDYAYDYATAKTAEAVRELVEGMRYMRQEFAGLPHSLAYDFTHLPKIDALLTKYAPKKEQDNG